LLRLWADQGRPLQPSDLETALGYARHTIRVQPTLLVDRFDLFFWLFGVAVLVFAVTLRFKPAVIVMFVSIAIYLLISYTREKRRPPAADEAAKKK